MATTLRFSNQGPIVLGLGGTYPNYASIPTVFGGPTEGILISVYNRGGAYVPNTAFNTSIPTTIGVGNTVDFSDYYTSSNYVSGSVPPVPNPRPIEPDYSTIFQDIILNVEVLPLPQIVRVGQEITIANLYSRNSLAANQHFQPNGVIIDGRFYPQSESYNPSSENDPWPVTFIVEGSMNYDSLNKSDVRISIIQLDDPYIIPNYFARNIIQPEDPTNFSISSTADTAGSVVTIGFRGDLINLEVENLINNGSSLYSATPAFIVTIGGIPQQVRNNTVNALLVNGPFFGINTYLAFEFDIIISPNTPTISSDIVIINNRGDKVTLPQKFRRTDNANPYDPTDRGGPPSINWEANEQIPETLNFTFTSNLSFANANQYIVRTPNVVGSNLKQNTNDPAGGNGNLNPVDTNNSKVQLVQSTERFVQIGTIDSDIYLPLTTANNQTRTLSINFSGDNWAANFGTSGVRVSASTSTSTAFGNVTQSNSSAITFNSGTNSFTINILIPQQVTNGSTVLYTAGTAVYAAIANQITTATSWTKADNTVLTLPANSFWYNTLDGNPIFINFPTLYPGNSNRGNRITTPLFIIESADFTRDVTIVALFGVLTNIYFFNQISALGAVAGAIKFSSVSSTRVFSLAIATNSVSILQNEDTFYFNYNLYYTRQQSYDICFTFITNFLLYTMSSSASTEISLGAQTYEILSSGSIFSVLKIFRNLTCPFTVSRTSTFNKYFTYINNIVFPYQFVAANFYLRIFNGISDVLLLDLWTTTFKTSIQPISIDAANTIINTTNDQIALINNSSGNIRASYYNSSVTWAFFENTFNGPRILASGSVNNLTPIVYNTPSSGYYVTYTSGSTTTTITTNSVFDYPTQVSWTFNRTASATYTALSIPIQLSSTDTNAQRAQYVATLLTSSWNGPTTPTYTITTGMSGETILAFNTNNLMPSNSTLMQTGSTTAGMFTLTTSGGSSGSNDNITRLLISGAPLGGPVYIGPSYGYINNLTFTHDGNSFSSTSAVILNLNQPSNLRELHNF